MSEKSVSSIKDLAEDKFQSLISSSELDDSILEKFFSEVLKEVISLYGLYPAWVCLNCDTNGFHGNWGKRPDSCDKCGKNMTFEVGNFQSRASKTGTAFEEAFYVLVKDKLQLPIEKTPHNT